MPRLSSADGSKRAHVGHGASCGYSLRVCRVPHGDEAHHCRRSALSWSVSHIALRPSVDSSCCPPVEFRAKRRSVHGEIKPNGGLYSVIFEMGWPLFFGNRGRKGGSFPARAYPRTDGHKDQREARTVRFAARVCGESRPSHAIKLLGSLWGYRRQVGRCSTVAELTSLRERIRSTCVETFTTENDDGRETNGPPVRVDVRWTVRDQPHPKCNRHLEWDDTSRLLPEGRSLAWRAEAACVERVSDPMEREIAPSALTSPRSSERSQPPPDHP